LDGSSRPPYPTIIQEQTTLDTQDTTLALVLRFGSHDQVVSA
jgi:hypothetical protein